MTDELFSTIEQLVKQGRIKTLLREEVAYAKDFRLSDEDTVGYNSYIFVLVESGTVDAEINYIKVRLQSGSLMMLKPFVLVNSFQADNEFHGEFIFVDRDFLVTIPESIRFHAVQNEFVSRGVVPIAELNECEMAEVCSAFKSVTSFIPGQTFERPMMLSRLSYLLLVASSAMKRNISNDTQTTSHKAVLFQNFLKLLRTHYVDWHKIDLYSKELGVSTRYLQRAVSEVTDRTVYSYISERLMIHARRLLASSDKTVEQISFQLHFSSLSSFGKFFKANSGMSPREFRTWGHKIAGKKK